MRVDSGDRSSHAKPGDLLDIATDLAIAGGGTYASRGAEKLAAALDAFLPLDAAVDPSGRTCLDVGASTGGFTDVLLRRGARRVYALDVGRGQLAQAIREDRRVISMEGVNARHLTASGGASALPEAVTLATIDVSFISLDKVLGPVATTFEAAGGRIVALVKPQFEAGRAEVRRGVVRDPDVHVRVVEDVMRHARAIGFTVVAETPSPLLGPAGNREFFLDLAVPPRA